MHGFEMKTSYAFSLLSGDNYNNNNNNTVLFGFCNTLPLEKNKTKKLKEWNSVGRISNWRRNGTKRYDE